MKCRDYIFQLTSGQLEDAGTATKIAAWQHRMVCFRCRAFSRNDQALQGLLKGYNDHIQTPQAPASKPADQ
ncbi:hypothetical protein M2375_002018 [Comamonas sp. BIGb0152]|uniref:hypothetical protein n=1 Tax=Comamonas sp. BIGb0152 TaxID=2940601 RepID=UPI002169998A|nr:hypothetical protein [Comamonas sp. BIGb0152]MCS4293786.1 hypothetical protein [Comamonas sp. BIGb0152]